ncbi:hypothetical protein [Halobacillus massiliensis]|uniref:hypothetical protein n=1 Tax=Halobacillus massiliensis TaxID=1926286 RepID=UPI0009E406D7|nr:hypothetical protein [Halobacillus massiliensis]
MNGDPVVWLNIFTVGFVILCFYFTLTFIENVHNRGEERITKQSKAAAIICLVIALFIPIIAASLI